MGRAQPPQRDRTGARLPPIGRSSDDVRLGGIEWTWRVDVLATEDKTLRRVNIAVERKDAKVKRSLAELSAFVSENGRAVQ